MNEIATKPWTKPEGTSGRKGHHRLYVPPTCLNSVLRFHALLLGLGASPRSDSHRVCKSQMGTERGLDPLWSLCPLKIPACGIPGPEDSRWRQGTMGGVFEGSGRAVLRMGHPPLGRECPEERGTCRGPSWERDWEEQGTSRAEGGIWPQR